MTPAKDKLLHQLQAGTKPSSEDSSTSNEERVTLLRHFIKFKIGENVLVKLLHRRLTTGFMAIANDGTDQEHTQRVLKSVSYLNNLIAKGQLRRLAQGFSKIATHHLQSKGLVTLTACRFRSIGLFLARAQKDQIKDGFTRLLERHVQVEQLHRVSAATAENIRLREHLSELEKLDRVRNDLLSAKQRENQAEVSKLVQDHQTQLLELEQEHLGEVSSKERDIQNLQEMTSKLKYNKLFKTLQVTCDRKIRGHTIEVFLKLLKGDRQSAKEHVQALCARLDSLQAELLRIKSIQSSIETEKLSSVSECTRLKSLVTSQQLELQKAQSAVRQKEHENSVLSARISEFERDMARLSDLVSLKEDEYARSLDAAGQKHSAEVFALQSQVKESIRLYTMCKEKLEETCRVTELLKSEQIGLVQDLQEATAAKEKLSKEVGFGLKSESESHG